jgi:hypothetical protein
MIARSFVESMKTMKSDQSERVCVENMSTMKIEKESESVCVENMSTMKDVFVQGVPSVAPLSDTSASSASCCYVERSPSDGDLSESSEDSAESLQRIAELDADAWIERSGATDVTRRVSWGEVETRLYPIIPGDHPDTWQGPPVRRLSLELEIPTVFIGSSSSRHLCLTF